MEYVQSNLCEPTINVSIQERMMIPDYAWVEAEGASSEVLGDLIPGVPIPRVREKQYDVW